MNNSTSSKRDVNKQLVKERWVDQNNNNLLATKDMQSTRLIKLMKKFVLSNESKNTEGIVKWALSCTTGGVYKHL